LLTPGIEQLTIRKEQHMADNERPQQRPQPQAHLEERGGAWEVIQQGARVFGEIGTGIGGIAAGVKVYGDKFGGRGDGSSSSSEGAPSRRHPATQDRSRPG
jgi:hypothetical protein